MGLHIDQDVSRYSNLTLYKTYTNYWTDLRRAESKRKKEFNFNTWEKTSNKTSLKIYIMKMQRNTAQMKEQIRNTEVQINEEEGNRQTT